MSQLQQGLQTWGDICATEFCDRGKALPPDPHALAFTFSVTVWKGWGHSTACVLKGTSTWLGKSWKNVSVLHLDCPSGKQWAEVSVGLSISEDVFLGHCFGVCAPPRLGAHIWICTHLVPACPAEDQAHSLVPVPAKQQDLLWALHCVSTAGFPKSVALWGVHGSTAPYFRNGYMSLQWEGLKCHLVGCLSASSEQQAGMWQSWPKDVQEAR